VACGGGGGPPSIDDLTNYIIDTECGIEVQCDQAPDEATCKASIQTMDKQSETVIADVKAGIIKYDGDKAKACFDAASASGCTFTGFHGKDDDPCATYLTGTVAAGGACFLDLECAGNAVCNATMSGCDVTTTCCPGTCSTSSSTAKMPIGGACSGTSDCVSTAYCKGATQTAMGTCSAVVATAGAACDSFDACANPMICNETSSTGGTCYTPGAHGGTCDPAFFVPDFACSDDRDYCDPATMKCISRVAVGATCSDTILCQGLSECVNTKCVANGTAGATCDSTNGPGCIQGLDCTNSKCTLPATGTSCR
jgi:hypothetical protein